MSWNYRIFKKKYQKTGEYYYGLYETFYDEKGTIEMWAERAEFGHGVKNEQGELHECPCFESVDDLISTLQIMLEDANKCKDDILDHDAEQTFPFSLESDYEGATNEEDLWGYDELKENED
jgi:hypothetical protein